MIIPESEKLFWFKINEFKYWIKEKIFVKFSIETSVKLFWDKSNLFKKVKLQIKGIKSNNSLSFKPQFDKSKEIIFLTCFISTIVFLIL